MAQGSGPWVPVPASLRGLGLHVGVGHSKHQKYIDFKASHTPGVVFSLGWGRDARSKNCSISHAPHVLQHNSLSGLSSASSTVSVCPEFQKDQ
jgi:hypothetical protein